MCNIVNLTGQNHLLTWEFEIYDAVHFVPKYLKNLILHFTFIWDICLLSVELHKHWLQDKISVSILSYAQSIIINYNVTFDGSVIF